MTKREASRVDTARLFQNYKRAILEAVLLGTWKVSRLGSRLATLKKCGEG
jgi:hypothetical protein